MAVGANLGTTSGIWLLAMAGQNVSLGPLAEAWDGATEAPAELATLLLAALALVAVGCVPAGAALCPRCDCSALVSSGPSWPAPGPLVKYHPPPARMRISRNEYERGTGPSLGM